MECRHHKILEGAPGEMVSPGAPSKAFRIFHCDRTLLAVAPLSLDAVSVLARAFRGSNQQLPWQLQFRVGFSAFQRPTVVVLLRHHADAEHSPPAR
jgi:hypothetical protein